MRADAEIRRDGLLALMDALGAVEAERFITLINRERLDYTEWRRHQWQAESVATLAARARALRAAREED
jgi:hypothetical protein